MTVISVTPQKMTSKIMDELETRGLIVRLTPSRKEHRLMANAGESIGEHIYSSSIYSGTHALGYATINNPDFSNFGSHPDNEDFLLLGGVNEKKLLILIALMFQDELEEKISNMTLSAADFICLEAVFNDPELSFFIMKMDVPHGECCYGEGLPATFYIAEGNKLIVNKIDFKDYKISAQY